MKHRKETLKEACYNAEIASTFPNSMPLLEEFRRIKVFDQKFLKEVTVLFIQHHLCPLVGRLQVMAKDGMESKNTWFIDIPYSTNIRVKRKIEYEYTDNQYPEPYVDITENYTISQLNRTISIVEKIIQTNPRKLLVVDDGAYFVRALYNLYLKNPKLVQTLNGITYVVEQTTRGHRYLESKKYSLIIKELELPIVSIARCKTKLDIESDFIGVACRKAIEGNDRVRCLMGNLINQGIKIGIIGYGSIGAAVFDAVNKLLQEIGCNGEIDVVEIELDKREIIEAHNGIPKPELDASGYDMLFGCTGGKSFTWYDKERINDGGLLISVSSATVEFSRSDFLEFANLYPDDPIKMYPDPEDSEENNIHRDLIFEYMNEKNEIRKFTFINGGFPVNFTGEMECLALDFIQPTHALMYSACYQVLNNPKPGLNSLSEEFDHWIYYNAFSHYKF